MTLFRRVLRWLFFCVGLMIGIGTAVAAIFARFMVNPPRQRLWATPTDLGIAYEDVQFPAEDGVRLSGWFIPAKSMQAEKGTIILVHGWLWNRLGYAADDLLANLSGSQAVDMLRLAHALHQRGFHVLMFDWRNHGESARQTPVTFGMQESNDLLGAVKYVNDRAEVDSQHVGIIAFSTGANILLHTLPRTPLIQAAVAVQPTTISLFSQRFADDMFGLFSQPIMAIVRFLYRLAGGPALESLRPETAVVKGFSTPVLYIQGEGDNWGSLDDVVAMATVTVASEAPLFVETDNRSEGYHYVIDNPDVATTFFERHFSA